MNPSPVNSPLIQTRSIPFSESSNRVFPTSIRFYLLVSQRRQFGPPCALLRAGSSGFSIDRRKVSISLPYPLLSDRGRLGSACSPRRIQVTLLCPRPIYGPVYGTEFDPHDPILYRNGQQLLPRWSFTAAYSGLLVMVAAALMVGQLAAKLGALA